MAIARELLTRGPNIIGATGGSGTRAVARIVSDAGLFIGTDLNASEDALALGAYSDRWINPFLSHRQGPLWPLLWVVMGLHLQIVLERHLAPLDGDLRPWGWKEPRSIYLLPFFHSRFPQLRFLQVVRDGRDMAFSSNQNQLRRHGRRLLGPTPSSWSEPLRSIAVWNRINLLAADYGQEKLGDRYLWIRFEDLCAQPTATTRRILDFFGLSGDAEEIARREVSPPATMGRWREQDPAILAGLHRIGAPALQRFGYWAPPPQPIGCQPRPSANTSVGV